MKVLFFSILSLLNFYSFSTVIYVSNVNTILPAGGGVISLNITNNGGKIGLSSQYKPICSFNSCTIHTSQQLEVAFIDLYLAPSPQFQPWYYTDQTNNFYCSNNNSYGIPINKVKEIPSNFGVGLFPHSTTPHYFWNNGSAYIYYGPSDMTSPCYSVQVGSNNRFGFKIPDSQCNSGDYIYGYIDYGFLNNGDVIIYGWCYEDNCNQSVPVVDIPNLGFDNHDNYKISITPNPSSNLIHIEIDNYNDYIFTEIYDLSGKILKTTINTTISLVDYPNGIYLLKVSYGDRVEEIKVVKE